MDKIRILLIDDDPGPLFDSSHIPDDLGEPERRSIIRDCFEVKWLATVGECRQYIDLIWELDGKSRFEGTFQGWIPELLFFDYAMTGNPRPIFERAKKFHTLSPIPQLEAAATALGLELSPYSDPPSTGWRQGEDDDGCYSGGSIFQLISGHPCGALPFTRKQFQAGQKTDSKLYEWLLSRQVYRAFDQKHGRQKSWYSHIKLGLPSFRRQLSRLIESNKLHVSLSELFSLAETGEGEFFTFTSKYETRRISLTALFLDIPAERLAQTISGWVKELLNGIFRQIDLETNRGGRSASRNAEALEQDYNHAVKFANAIMVSFNCRMSDFSEVQNDELIFLPFARAALANLLNKSKTEKLIDEEDELLARLSDYFEVERIESKRGMSHRCRKHVLSITSGEQTALQRRWAALMVMVNLLKLRKDGKIKVEQMKSAGGHVPPEVETALRSEITTAEAMEVLFHATEEADFTQEDFTMKFKGRLRRWGSALDENYGSLALILADVLAGKSWDHAAGTYGFFPGERFMLEHYAGDIGLDLDELPLWLRPR
jgi:hypothetical protein